MAAVPTLSTETGDSRIRSGTRLAEMTTSVPRSEAVLKSTWTGVDALLTVTSCVSKPMDEKMRTNGGCRVVVSRKLPLSSVNVPAAEPLRVTETAGIFSLLIEFCTLPVMVTGDWEKVAAQRKRHATNE